MLLIIFFLVALGIGSIFFVCKIWADQEKEFNAEYLTNNAKVNKKRGKNLIEEFGKNEGKFHNPLKIHTSYEKVDSQKVADLIALNSATNFHAVRSSFKIDKRYDNKSSFNKIDPASLMAADIRENIEEYAKYIAQVKENREQFASYQKKVDELFQKEYPVDADSINMPLERYYKCEARMFNDIKLKPVVDCLYYVKMSYSSPKRKVNLRKEDFFDFDEMFACFESMSRSHLDRNTYQKLAAVERGEVSDSLRYDIMCRDNFTCVLCGASAREGVRLHVDHIIPIAKGGKSTPDNLRTLCERCNVGKSDKIETTPESIKTEQGSQVCQWCGGKLVLRRGKNGEFYGCSNYPKCRYTKSK